MDASRSPSIPGAGDPSRASSALSAMALLEKLNGTFALNPPPQAEVRLASLGGGVWAKEIIGELKMQKLVFRFWPWTKMKFYFRDWCKIRSVFGQVGERPAVRLQSFLGGKVKGIRLQIEYGQYNNSLYIDFHFYFVVKGSRE